MGLDSPAINNYSGHVVNFTALLVLHCMDGDLGEGWGNPSKFDMDGRPMLTFPQYFVEISYIIRNVHTFYVLLIVLSYCRIVFYFRQSTFRRSMK